MIRRRDYLRLTTQKLALRKRRAAFAILSVMLGVIVVVTVDSLLEGVRKVAVKTMWTEELDPDQIRVYAAENPYEFPLPNEGRKAKPKTKQHTEYLTESVFQQIRAWPGVEAADRPVVVHPVSIDAFAKWPQKVNELQGVPEAVLLRYVKTPSALNSTSNAIPLVLGEHNTRLRFDEKHGKLESDAAGQKAWLGREVTIVIGDNYAGLSRFRYDYKKREYQPVSEDELTTEHDSMDRNLRSLYDTAIYNTTLPLKARVVGFCPGSKAYIPLDEAVLCEKWLDQRERLAALHPPAETNEVVYEEDGRRSPKPGEYTEGMVLVKHGADIEAIAKRIDEMGFSATTRARAFENQVRAFDSGMRIVKRVAFAFGGLILAMAGALVWSTTSKTVSDARVDIGLFRALGATKREIRRLFLGEAVLQGLLGTVFGMLLGWGLALLISRWVIHFAQRNTFDPEEALLLPNSIFSINLKFCLLLIASSAILSLLAGLLPANRAANVDPVKALKRE